MAHLLLAMVLLVIGVTVNSTLTKAADIVITAPPIYPEGIAYSPLNKNLYLSAMHTPTIGVVSMDEGKFEPFSDDRELVSVSGLRIDEKRNRLLACVSDLGVSPRSSLLTRKKLARLVSFSLSSRKKLKSWDLGSLVPGEHFCNDIALDRKGNVYVTDSYSPVIYKIDSSDKASVFFKSPKFAGDGTNLNGILAHPDGYLLVSWSQDGSLWRIKLSDPNEISEVKLPRKLKGADGLIFLDDRTIALVQNQGFDQVHKLYSLDGWKTASIVRSSDKLRNFPTTGVKYGDGILVSESQLNVLFSGKPAKSTTKFVIRHLKGF